MRNLRGTCGLLVFFCALLIGGAARAADTTCGNQACSESVCSRSDVVLCSDWDDGARDGWAYSSNVGSRGDVREGVGLGGTRGWEHEISVGTAVTLHIDAPIPQSERVHARFAFRLSPNYRHRMVCGLQKLFYLRVLDGGQLVTRIMLGVTAASDMGGAFADLSDATGVVGFDYDGHIVQLPTAAGDTPVLIYPDRWYSVEIMADYRSGSDNTVKVWIDGQLSITREDHVDGSWQSGLGFNNVQDTSWFGGVDSCNELSEGQSVFKDNTVIASEYIGPAPAPGPPPETDPEELGIPGVPDSRAP